jgi:hypothetical protein
VSTIPRTAVGYALFTGGLTFLVYGIAQAIMNGSCGTDESGYAVGPPCPSGFGPMIALMVLGSFAAVLGVALAAWRRGGIVRFVFVSTFATLAGVVLGFADLHDDDTRPGLEIVAAVAVPAVLLTVPVAFRTRTTPPPPPPQAPQAGAEEIAARLRQLEQLKDSGLLDDAAYRQRRGQILAEL